MGEARSVMDRMTAAMIAHDEEAVAAAYAVDAIAITPDAGEIKGREQVAEYVLAFTRAFPDARFELVVGYEDGTSAIDEGYLVGTNTGEITMPTGETMPATGRAVRLRTCDIATVEHGLIVRHSFHFDQLAFMTQLGLLDEG